jgi:hypothetical protein
VKATPTATVSPVNVAVAEGLAGVVLTVVGAAAAGAVPADRAKASTIAIFESFIIGLLKSFG